MNFRQTFALFLLSALSVLAAPVAADDGMGYQVPSQALVDLIDADNPPWVSVSPSLETMLLMRVPSLPSIEELAEEELRLAGYRIKPATNGPSRGWEVAGLSVMSVDGGDATPIEGLPESPRIRSTSWSADGSKVLFTNTVADGIELWMADMVTKKAKRLTDARVNLAAGVNPRWDPDGRSILVALVPDGRGDAPASPRVPSGPTVQENLGRTTPARTYQDLLENAHDEALFDHYFTAQIARVDLSGRIENLGGPAIYRDVDVSPNGDFVLVEFVKRPYSYLVPASRFPRTVQVWDAKGRVVATVADKPLQDSIPIAFGSTETGPRSHGWRNDAPATLVYAEAQDGGDAGAEAALRDKVFLLSAPFTGKPVEIAALEQRYGGTYWSDDDLAIVSSWWWPTRSQRAWRIAPGDPSKAPELLIDHNWEDRYNDPGEPMVVANAMGRNVLQTDGRFLFLVGDGASDEGDRPFLDRYDLETKQTERLFRSEAPHYESVVEVLDLDGNRLLTRRESVDSPPNYYVRHLGDGSDRQVTAFAHPTPQLKGIQKELVRYEREDGVMLTGTLYTPAGYDPARDGRLPTLLWAYPTEYKSADAAGQVTDSPYRFVRIGWWSPQMWVVRGYAVLDDPSMPIIGEGDEEPNDTYIAQLVSSAAAAIDKVVDMGVTDRDRVAIGGHSYGAFMTANLLAHSDLFAAGIARSGAYNRTLTPFGFQAEERSFWEASDVYFEMSPFMHAEKVNEPILLIHGEADNNSGTFPIQSKRFYSALKGLGGTARLVMLPHESHGYRARESILHMMWETEQWLDTYVKGDPLPDGLERAGGPAGRP